MVKYGNRVCPNCGGHLKYYDSVKRLVRKKFGKNFWITIKRYRCSTCYSVHRELTDEIEPYKQYESEIIQGVREGYISSDTLGYEDYPCEVTMERWLSQK